MPVGGGEGGTESVEGGGVTGMVAWGSRFMAAPQLAQNLYESSFCAPQFGQGCDMKVSCLFWSAIRRDTPTYYGAVVQGHSSEYTTGSRRSQDVRCTPQPL